MKKTRKILAMAISVVMILSLLPSNIIQVSAATLDGDLYVGNTKITGTSSGNGWSYDLDTNTLTLSDIEITNGYTFNTDIGANAGIYFSSNSYGTSLKIVLEGANTINMSSDRGLGICLGANTTSVEISGSGTLSIITNYRCINADGRTEIKIKDTTLNLEGSSDELINTSSFGGTISFEDSCVSLKHNGSNNYYMSATKVSVADSHITVDTPNEFYNQLGKDYCTLNDESYYWRKSADGEFQTQESAFDDSKTTYFEYISNLKYMPSLDDKTTHILTCSHSNCPSKPTFGEKINCTLGSATCLSDIDCLECGRTAASTDVPHDAACVYDNGFYSCGAADIPEEIDGVYQIGNAAELYWYAGLVNGSLDGVEQNEAANAVLTADIDLENRAWQSIGGRRYYYVQGYETYSFATYKGTFDGKGHTIKNLTVPETRTNQGLFGFAESAVIKNLGIVNANIKGVSVGAILGRGDGDITITNCFVRDSSLTAAASSSTITFAAPILGNYGSVSGKTYNIANCYTYNCTLNSVAADGVTNIENPVAPVTKSNCYYGEITSTNTLSATTSTKKTSEEFASGEVAYLLQGEQTEHIWGQTIGEEAYPVFGGTKVVLDGDTYKNQYTEFEILLNGADGTKATATVTIPTAGTYTVIFADYENGRLNNFDTVTQEFSDGKITVPSEIDITLGTGDKIMLWSDMTKLVPKCEAYIVK